VFNLLPHPSPIGITKETEKDKEGKKVKKERKKT